MTPRQTQNQARQSTRHMDQLSVIFTPKRQILCSLIQARVGVRPSPAAPAPSRAGPEQALIPTSEPGAGSEMPAGWGAFREPLGTVGAEAPLPSRHGSPRAEGPRARVPTPAALCPHLPVLLQALPVGPLAGGPRRAQRFVGAGQDGEAHLPAPGALLLLLLPHRRRPRGPRAAPGRRRRLLLVAGQDGDLVVAGPAAGEPAPHLGAQPRTHRHGAAGRRPVCADLGRFLRRCATGVAGGGRCPLPGAGRLREEALGAGGVPGSGPRPRCRSGAGSRELLREPGIGAHQLSGDRWALTGRRSPAPPPGCFGLGPARAGGTLGRSFQDLLPTAAPLQEVTLFRRQRKGPSSLDIPQL